MGTTEAESVLAENPDSDLSGIALGNYKLLKRLGVGGMGSVYLAQHSLLGRHAAIKVMPQETELGKSSALERFRLESRAIASLNHPNIVRAHDFSSQGAIHYLVMEYVEGTNLDKLILDHGPLAEEVAADFVRQAADGLAEVHKAGLVHRDIKPANLLLEKTGVVKLLDLGVVRYADGGAGGEEASLTLKYKEQLLGTVDYLAPEQGLDSHQVDARSDIYSLGCTFYFLLMGRPPFSDGTLAQRMLMHQLHDAPRIEDFRKGISPAIAGLVRKMLAKRPSERVQTATEIAQILANWLAERNHDKEAARTGTSIPRPSQIILPDPISPSPLMVGRDSSNSGSSITSKAMRETLSGRADETLDWREHKEMPVEDDSSSDYTPAFERKRRRPLTTGYFTVRRIMAAIIFGGILAAGVLMFFTAPSEAPKQLTTTPTNPELATETHPNGQRAAQGKLVNGARQGHWTMWNDKGEKIAEGDFQNGLETGPWTYWVKNGQRQKDGSFRAGKKHGPWMYRYDDGQQQKSGRFQEDQEDGRWTFWHPNGQKSSEGEFKAGQKVEGTWKSWDPSGNPVDEKAAVEKK